MLASGRGSDIHRPAATQKISVFRADDNLIVREGVGALLQRKPDIEVVRVAADFDGLVAGAEQAGAQVVVTDIRMPQRFNARGLKRPSLFEDASQVPAS